MSASCCWESPTPPASGCSFSPPLSCRSPCFPSPFLRARMPFGNLWKLSPVGLAGSLGAGLANGAIFAMGPVYGISIGMSVTRVSLLMATLIFGSVALQWPIGSWSDRVPRRRARRAPRARPRRADSPVVIGCSLRRSSSGAPPFPSTHSASAISTTCSSRSRSWRRLPSSCCCGALARRLVRSPRPCSWRSPIRRAFTG